MHIRTECELRKIRKRAAIHRMQNVKKSMIYLTIALCTDNGAIYFDTKQ